MNPCSSAPREAGPKTAVRIGFLAALVASLAVANLAAYGRLRVPPLKCAIVGADPASPRAYTHAREPEDEPPVGRVVIIAAVTEQLGKATAHVEDMFDLCQRSNRTCVLPGIASGQFALDGFLNFDDVFDGASIPTSVQAIVWERYARYLRQLSSPRIVMCAFGKERVDPRHVAMFQRTVLFYQPNTTFEFDDACSTIGVGFPADPQQQEANLEAMMAVLGRDDPITAVFHFDWSEPIPKSAERASADYTGLEFSAQFYEQAMAFRQRVGDYIHLQWRMEKADGGRNTNYTACAVAAIQHVRSLAQNSSVGQVYFSSDVGRDGVPWSNSFGTGVPKDALNAIKLIYDEFPDLLTWVNVSAPMHLSRYDMAAVGVMDRLIAMGSTYFVRGPKECSRVGAYVQSIARWRKKRRASTRDTPGGTPRDDFGSKIMNEVDEYAL